MRTPLLAILPVLLLVGCDGGSDGPIAITKTRVTRTPDKQIDLGASEAQRYGYARPRTGGKAAGPHGKPRMPAQAFQLQWATPKGWKELSPTSNRTANFTIPDAPGVQCYLTKLLGRAGGVAANVNRWRGQFGLPAMSPAELGRLPHKRVLNVMGTFVEMTGTFQKKPNQKMFGLILPFRGQSIFVKMTGDAKALDRHRPGLEFFLRSLVALAPGQKRRPKTVKEPKKTPHHGSGEPDTKAVIESFGLTVHWTPPKGWVQGVKKRLRVITFRKEPGLDLYMTVFKPSAVAPNVNRWRRQMKTAALSDQEIKDLPTIEVLGRPAPLVEIRGTFTPMGPGAKPQPNSMMMGAIVAGPGCVIYVKLTGPEDAVQKQRQTFIAFCTSLRVGK